MEDRSAALEQRLLPMWRSVLGDDRVAVTDSFFERGGDSLLAVRLIVAVREELGRPRLSVREVFRHPTVREFATHLASVDRLRG